jgi:hypothetical protein
MDKEYLKYHQILQMVKEHKLIKEIGIKIKCKTMVYINMHVDQYIKDNGKIINIKEKEPINLLMEPYMKDNGRII